MAVCKHCGVDKDKIQQGFLEALRHASELVHKNEILEATIITLKAKLVKRKG